MSLPAGTRLGRYEILKPLGAGGMGEVYRARDTRLDRDVAIKILPASVSTDPERLARFEREAKAVAALSHPNILALHDAGTENGIAFAVMELLEGETLRERLNSGPLPTRRAIETAIQIARGLAAAHAKGLIHRDLKPENVFLVADGQVKILDFGLAKAAEPGEADATASLVAMTDPGTVLGTVGYMAPEQIRGHAIDARTDLFALGAVLFEMVTGQRAFRRDTAAETMTAILREDPPDLPAPQAAQAPALDRIIRHCLEKSPAERFQSAKDVAFALEALSGTTSTPVRGYAGTQGTRSTTGSRQLAAWALALVVIAGLAAWALGYVRVGRAGAGGAGVADITYQPITFDEGFVFAARFERDGRKIVYSADWENQKERDIFETSLDSSDARPLGFKGADLLAVAPDGALAILVKSIIVGGNPYSRKGTIARASLNGGAAREQLDGISFADFARDGDLAVTRDPKGRAPAIEWPQGKVIVDENTNGAWSSFPNPRLSPSADHVAYFTCFAGDCRLRIADKAGKTIAESRTFADWWGLAWAPGGREVWFSVAETNRQCTVFAIDVTGRQRLILRVPGAMTIHDVSADGKMLAAFDTLTRRLEMRDTPSSPARDLSWKEGGRLQAVAANGALLFDEMGDSGGPGGSVYVRRPGELEPIRISDGQGIALSDDGSTALVVSLSKPWKLSLAPTSGLTQTLDVGPLDAIETASWLKDGRLVLALRRQPGEPFGVFVRPAAGGPIVPLLPAGKFFLGPRAAAPDGAHLAAGEENGSTIEICTVPSAGMAACVPVPGTTPDDIFAGWTADSSGILVYRNYPVPVKVERVDVATGRRTTYTTLHPASAAVSGLSRLFVTPSGALVYNYGWTRSALYVISGLK